METIKIPFTGINRSIDEGISTDGQCMELINARIKNGSIEPIGKPVLLDKIPIEVSRLFYHTLAKRFIAISKQGIVYSLNEDYTIDEQLSSDLNSIVEHIEFIGKIACIITRSGIRYILFSNGAYSYLGEKPEFTFHIWAEDEKEITITDKIYDCKFTDVWAGDLTIDYRDVNPFLDFLDACKNEALAPYQNEARIVEPVCVRAALRMYDGTYICHSPIYIMCPISNLKKSIETLSGSYISPGTNNDYGKIKVINQTLYSYILKYSYNITDFDVWKNLILSLDIFISRPFSIIDAESCVSLGITIGNVANQVRLRTYNRETMLDKIISASSMLYSSVSLTGDNGEGVIEGIGDTSSQLLIDDNSSSASLYPQASYVYNNRLHLGNINSILFSGFAPHYFQNDYDSSYNGYQFEKRIATAKIYTYLLTDEGEKIVYTEGALINPLNPIFCYPDNRAYKAVIFAALPSTNDTIIYRKKTIDLKKATNLNMAFYLEFDTGMYRGIWPIDLSTTTEITESEFKNPDININDTEYNPNKLKVSSLNNPLSFPASQTYQPSSEEIIGMCANTNALSQGQFGQHPLYVFSQDGIYAMSVGTGNIVYSNQTPVSRDTCINKKSIKGIDQAVVFASKRGLMMISGTSITLLSGDMDGYLPSCVISSPIIPKIADIASMGNALSSVAFNDYLDDAEISYNYQENELYISNKGFQYAYAFNIMSSSWSKLHPNVDTFVNKYPECWAIIGNGIYDMQNSHRSITKMLLLSKPIKMGSNSHKRILQTALRGIVKRALSDLYLRGEPVMFRGEDLNLFSDVGFYILGSNDAEHFALISGKESIVDIRDLVTKMNKSKPYKYFMVALVGGVRTDVSLNYMEFIASEAFANRLR